MVASCYRRSSDYSAALEKYKWIHQHFPEDTDCIICISLWKDGEVRTTVLGIQFLVKIANDLSLPERASYEAELKKVNKMKEIQLQVSNYLRENKRLSHCNWYFQRQKSADQSRNIVKGRKVSSLEPNGNTASHSLSLYQYQCISVSISNSNRSADEHRKRTPIDLNNTEGVFSQQGLLILMLYQLI